MNDAQMDSINFQLDQANKRLDKMLENLQTLEATGAVHGLYIRALASTLKDAATLKRVENAVVAKINESIRSYPTGRWGQNLREAHQLIDLSTIRLPRTSSRE